MASVNAKINGQFVKIPNYTSADVDHIQYDGTRTFQDNTLGKKVKDIDATVVAHSQEIVNLNKLGLYIDSNGNIIDIWED